MSTTFRVSLDGGATYVDAPMGVNVIVQTPEAAATPTPTELSFLFEPEGHVTVDVWSKTKDGETVDIIGTLSPEFNNLTSECIAAGA